MTKKELIERIAENAGLTKKAAEIALNSVLEGIEESLINEGKMSFIGFGTFEVRERAAREGKNPKTGEVIQIAASKTVGFKTSKNLKEKLK